MNQAEHCLQLDVGNGSTKWRLMHDGKLASRGTYRADEPDSEQRLLGCCTELQQIWVSSVAAPAAEQSLQAMLMARWGVQPWFARSTASVGELRNSYADPARLGVDRWLAMLGARARVTGRFCVVDAGSALTLDIVAADGAHEGGYIIPGPFLMERALLIDTGQVRFAENAEYKLCPGRSTAEAVRHGITVAQVGALREVLRQAEGEGELHTLFCGGGGRPLMELAGVSGTLAPDLIFEGLEIAAAGFEETGR
jgi:type III pantothenate kinase